MRIKDSGRSWLLLAITTFSMLLELGTIKALSVLLPSMKEQLKTEAWIVGSSIAVIQGFGYTFGKLKYITDRQIWKSSYNSSRQVKSSLVMFL